MAAHWKRWGTLIAALVVAAGCAANGKAPGCKAGPGCACTESTTCGAGLYCRSGACVACSATDPAHCGDQSAPAGCRICSGHTPDCSNGACVCGADSDCGAGHWCSNGACVACSATDPAHCGDASAPAGCKVCSGDTPDCSGGACVCGADSDCGAGHWCANGACVACSATDPDHCGDQSSPAGCKVCSGDTPGCANGVCVCTADSDCGAGRWCANGACVACSATDPARCGDASSPAGCKVCSGDTPGCANGACVCASDASCGNGRWCSNGACAACSLTDAARCGTSTSPAGCVQCSALEATCENGACLAMNCYDLLKANPGLPSGDYLIDPDGAGPLPPMMASCDMVTDGGGWTLVLNYLHAAGTNPDLVLHDTSLPLLGSTTLGTDESGTAHWGQASSALIAALDPTEVRFYGRTSADDRIINFKVARPWAIALAKTGTGSLDGLPAAFTPLDGHTANLPAQADSFGTDEGDYALDWQPFYKAGAYYWNINPPGPDAGRWEVDDQQSGGPTTSASTLHQVWVRSGPSCADGIKDGDETDVDCGGSCDKCGDGKLCNSNADCISGGTCTAGTDGSRCVCPTVCGSQSDQYCADTTTDFYNCGACGRSCILSQACRDSTCVDLPSGDPTSRIDIVATCSDSPTMANFDLTNENNNFDVDISYDAWGPFTGGVIVGSMQTQQVFVGKGSVCAFSYNYTLFKQMVTNDQLCSDPPNPEYSIFAFGICSNATSSVYLFQNNNTISVPITYTVGSNTYNVNLPPNSATRVETPKAEAQLSYDGTPFVIVSPSFYQCPQ